MGATACALLDGVRASRRPAHWTWWRVLCRGARSGLNRACWARRRAVRGSRLRDRRPDRRQSERCECWRPRPSSATCPRWTWKPTRWPPVSSPVARAPGRPTHRSVPRFSRSSARSGWSCCGRSSRSCRSFGAPRGPEQSGSLQNLGRATCGPTGPLGVTLALVFEVNSIEALAAAFAASRERNAEQERRLLSLDRSSAVERGDQRRLAFEYKLPATRPFRRFACSVGLLSLWPEASLELYRQAGAMVGRSPDRRRHRRTCRCSSVEVPARGQPQRPRGPSARSCRRPCCCSPTR